MIGRAEEKVIVGWRLVGHCAQWGGVCGEAKGGQGGGWQKWNKGRNRPSECSVYPVMSSIGSTKLVCMVMLR
jgi:hypothetical protein